jgi:hypothetical protein
MSLLPLFTVLSIEIEPPKEFTCVFVINNPHPLALGWL